MESALLAALGFAWVVGAIVAFSFFLRNFTDFPPNAVLLASVVSASVLWPCLLVVMFFWFVKDKQKNRIIYHLRTLCA
jgi:hypothetical protein